MGDNSHLYRSSSALWSSFDPLDDDANRRLDDYEPPPIEIRQRAAPPTLRSYQTDIIARLALEVSAGHKHPLMVAPTGAGKTVIAGAIVRNATERGERVLFLAHRRELIKQTSEKLYAVDVDHGIVQAGFPARSHVSVQIASIQTLHARAVRSHAIGFPDADLVIVDEAHHARAESYQQILSQYPEAVILGMTATPCRGDGRGLGSFFDTLIECPGVDELTKLGYLVGTKVYAPVRPDLTGVHVRRGDYVESELSRCMNTQQLVGGVVEHWHKLAGHRRTVVFAVDVAHSVHLRDEFRRSGVLAEHIDGSTPIEERDGILKRLAEGKIEVVCNCMVLTEGWDSPDVSCIVLARPTKSLGLNRQMTGRGLRPSAGKADCLILDHAGAVFSHGFVDDPILWTLHEDDRACNNRHASRGRADGPPGLTTCPECAAVRFEGKPCAVCGWRPRARPQDTENAIGILGEVKRDRSVNAISAQEKARFHAMVAYIADEKGYKRGWAAYKFKEKFGHWPHDNHVKPSVPDSACRSWIRSRQIAYAKAKEKEARVTV